MKKIKLLAEDIDSISNQIKDKLTNNVFMSDTFNVDLSEFLKVENHPKATLLFEPEAYIKMMSFVRLCDKEIAWHGIVNRINDTTFSITDVLLYPQIITGVTVNTDTEEYAKWTETLDNDTFNNLRFQGHSHVNMATNPSGTDNDYYKQQISDLTDDDYYIFMIINKSHSVWCNIYDLKNNILYQNGDIEIDIGDYILSDCDSDIKEYTKNETVVNTNTNTNTNNWIKSDYYYELDYSQYRQKRLKGEKLDEYK